MKLITQIAALTMFAPFAALAQAPLACEGINGDVFLAIAGSSAQIWHSDDKRQTGAAIQIDQEHDGLPSAWALSVAGAQGTMIVQEAACTATGGQFPLSFVLLVNQQLTHGCCAVAE